MAPSLEQSKAATAWVLPWPGALWALLPPGLGRACWVPCLALLPPTASTRTGGERADGAARLGRHPEETTVHPAGGLRERPGCLHQPLCRVSRLLLAPHRLAPGAQLAPKRSEGSKKLHMAPAQEKGAGMPSTGVPTWVLISTQAGAAQTQLVPGSVGLCRHVASSLHSLSSLQALSPAQLYPKGCTLGHN